MPKQSFSWINALVIDDSQAILNFVCTLLEENYGVQNIYQATSANAAMQILRKSKNINLVLVDLNMPTMDGIQLLGKIKAINYLGYIAIMSGVATRIISSVELIAKESKLNYIGSLVKPLDERDFDKIFASIGQSRPTKHQVEPLRTYEIIRAIKNNDLKLLYQPQISLANKKFIGVEALCRLRHPSLGMITPDRFINKAEQSELIQHITTAVCQQALTDWCRWQKMGLDLILSVNISPINLQQPAFADNLLSLMADFNMPAEKLCLEVTESVLANDQLQELSNLSRLNMQDINIALDGFGNQLMALDRLKMLPLNSVKLDKSYFLEQHSSLRQIKMLNTSIALAQQLQLSICAKGVESKQAMALAIEMGCDTAQGFYIAHPLPANDILLWAHEWQKSIN